MQPILAIQAIARYLQTPDITQTKGCFHKTQLWLS